ncbi:MAG: SAM-dependent methyltransferase, partial [Myxococcota bacterium]
MLAGGHLTSETLGALTAADDVLYLTADPASEAALLARRPDARSLADCYAPGRRRERSYEEMLRRIAAPLTHGRTVCAAFYGHPGVFAWAPHEAVARARALGHEARMLPSVSAEDCLVADLELDPAALGWQSFEASDFLLRPRRIDTHSALVLWQIGAIGVDDYRREALWSREGLWVLESDLRASYPAAHEVVLYEAAQYAVCA